MGIKNKYKKVKKILAFDYEIAQGKVDTLIEKVNNLEKINNRLEQNIAELEIKINDVNKLISEINKSNSNLLNFESLRIINETKTGKKKILICGFYGAVNLGDELMLLTLLKEIDIEKYDVTLMLCDNPQADLTQYGKCNIIHYPTNTLEFNILANYYDCLIFGGGALIDDIQYNENGHISLSKILIDMTTQFITFNKKTILYGLSTNKEINDLDFIRKLSFLVENCTYFSLRDTHSIETLKKCGIETSKIHLVDDIVFANNYMITNNNSRDYKIGMIFICTHETEKQVEKYIKTIIDYLKSNNKKYTISLIPFYNYNNNDEVCFKRIIANIKDKNINVLSMPKNMEELQKVFNEYNYFVSMRYHATLIANLMNKKVLNIIYSKHRHYENKMKYIYDHYKFEENSIIFGETINKNDLERLFLKKGKPKEKKYINNAKKDIKSIIEIINK